MIVLVVDDDPAMTDLLRITLEPVFKNVVESNSAAEGVDLVKKLSPDVVIMDLMMPGMNGWDACQAIRKFSNVPILILSALDNPVLVAQALNAGADDFLVKPVASNILVAHINKLVRRARTTKVVNTNAALNLNL